MSASVSKGRSEEMSVNVYTGCSNEMRLEVIIGSTVDLGSKYKMIIRVTLFS